MSQGDPFTESLCRQCRFLQVVTSGRGSTFLMCKAPRVERYPRQPVLACSWYEPGEPD